MKKIDQGSNMRFEKIYADILKPSGSQADNQSS